MKPGDIKAVVKIHQERFFDSRSGKLGKPFLRKIYTWFSTNYPPLALVAVDKEDHVIGFITATLGPYTQRIFRNALPQIAWGLIINPRLAINSSTFKNARNYIKGFFIRNKPVTLYGISAEEEKRTLSYASLAVTFTSEGAGVPLIMAIENAAKKIPDIDLMSTWVKAKNESLIKIYKAFGWKVVWEDGISVRLIKKVTKN